MKNGRHGLVRVNTAIDTGLGRAEAVLLTISVGALFTMMVLIFLDAALRYTLNSPLKFTVDLVTEYLLSAAMFLVLSFTLRRGGHVAVDIFAGYMAPRIRHTVLGTALLVSAVVAGLMALRVSELTWDSLIRGEVMIGMFPWPIWLSKALVAVSLIALDLRVLHIGAANLLAGLLDAPELAISVTHLADEPADEGI